MEKKTFIYQIQIKIVESKFLLLEPITLCFPPFYSDVQKVSPQKKSN